MSFAAQGDDGPPGETGPPGLIGEKVRICLLILIRKTMSTTYSPKCLTEGNLVQTHTAAAYSARVNATFSYLLATF